MLIFFLVAQDSEFMKWKCKLGDVSLKNQFTYG